MSACWGVWSGGKTEVGVCVLARVEWRENGSRNETSALYVECYDCVKTTATFVGMNMQFTVTIDIDGQ